MRLRRPSSSLPLLAMLLPVAIVAAQEAPSLAGRWEGTLVPRVSRSSRELSRANAPEKLPTVVVITTSSDGTHGGTWASTSQRGITEIDEITIDRNKILIRVPSWSGRWQGTLSADGTKLEGSWEQRGMKTPLVLTKVAAQ